MSKIEPIELPRGTLEVLASIVVTVAASRPEIDIAGLWGRLLEETWPGSNSPLMQGDLGLMRKSLDLE